MANSNLTHTASAGNQKTWTFSAWVKRSNLGAISYLYNQGSAGNTFVSIYINSDDTFRCYNETSSNQTLYFVTNRLFRDTSAWYHIVVQCDTTQATESDRFKIWINGSQETSFSSASYPAQNSDTNMNVNSTVQRIGVYNASGSNANHYWDGYMSHVALVDGAAVAPTVFGETNSTSSIWKFKSPSGVTWGTNGFHLKFENSGALGTDSSGNTNTFTVNGNLKQALDTPSNVYATLNPLVKQGSTLSNGNNTSAYGSGSWKSVIATLGMETGKFYYEAKLVSGSAGQLGVASSKDNGGYATTESGALGNSSGCLSVNFGDGSVQTDGGSGGTAQGFTVSAGDIVGCAVDMTNSKIYWSKNGVWGNSSNPATGANATTIATGLTNFLPLLPAISVNNSTISTNFGNGFFGTTAVTSNSGAGEQDDAGQGKFQYDVPSGYYALNTKNINTYG